MHLPSIRRTVTAVAVGIALIGASACSPGSNGAAPTTTTTTTTPATSPDMSAWTDLAVEVLHGDQSPIDADALAGEATAGGPVAVIELLTRTLAGSDAARSHIAPLGESESMTDRAHEITSRLGVDDPSDEVIQQVVTKAGGDPVELAGMLLLLTSPIDTTPAP